MTKRSKWRSPSSKPCCVEIHLEPAMRSGGGSAHCSTSSIQPNAQTISAKPDMPTQCENALAYRGLVASTPTHCRGYEPIRSVMPQLDRAARPAEPDRGQTKFRRT